MKRYEYLGRIYQFADEDVPAGAVLVSEHAAKKATVENKEVKAANKAAKTSNKKVK